MTAAESGNNRAMPSPPPVAGLVATPRPAATRRFAGVSAVGLALGSALPPVWIIPVVATVLWTALFLALALWRFGREEF